MSGWQPDGMGIQDGNGSYSVRFIRPDMPGSLVTITFYPVIYSGRPGVYSVERAHEWVTGTSKDSRYAEVPGVAPQRSLEVASRLARTLAGEALQDAASITWDGQPFHKVG